MWDNKESRSRYLIKDAKKLQKEKCGRKDCQAKRGCRDLTVTWLLVFSDKALDFHLAIQIVTVMGWLNAMLDGGQKPL